jgi:Ser/Thr protein kinase RdoA (MazF antagonist)
MLAGYAKTFSLNEHEIEVLPVLLMSRVATSLVMGLYSHHFKSSDDAGCGENQVKKEEKEGEFQDNTAYLLKSQETGWNILEAFIRETPEKLANAYAGIFAHHL